jgi:polyvinyl alcohol dehydrogenase (cytochrome)
VVLGGNVYFADWGGNVYSASVSTGQVNWEVNLGYVPITSTLLLANGMVYVGDGSGPPGGQAVLFALSQTDGHVVWSTQLDTDEYAVFASPIIFNGMVYIGVATNGSETDTSLVGKVFAVNATTGHVNWSFTASIGNTGGAGVWGSVAIDPSLDSIYFGTSNAYGPGTDSLYSYSIMSLNARTGSLNWYYQAYNSLSSGGDLDFGSTPNLFSVVVNGVTHAAIGLGGKDGMYYVLDRVTGSLLEKFQIGTGSGEGGIIGLPGFIYLGTNNPELFIGSYNTVVGGDYGVMKALTPATGSIDWAFNTPGTIVGSVVVVPGAVVFGDESGNVFALSTGSGSQLFHTSVPGSVLGGVSAAEGLLFVPMSFGTGGTGGVYAYG